MAHPHHHKHRHEHLNKEIFRDDVFDYDEFIDEVEFLEENENSDHQSHKNTRRSVDDYLLKKKLQQEYDELFDEFGYKDEEL